MKLKAKILTFSLVPLILLGITLFLVSADRIANGIYDEAYGSRLSFVWHSSEDAVKINMNLNIIKLYRQ